MSHVRPNDLGGSTDSQNEPWADKTRTLVRPVSGSVHAPESGTGTDTTLPTHRQRGARTDSTALPVMDPTRYAIAGELAHGGTGRILRARDLRLDRPVAIKELLTPAREAEPRFVAEALVTARLQHPSIVPVYEAGRWPGGEPFYAMKLVSGRSLADVIAERKMLEERLALLPHVLAVAEAMAYAHSERIIHRDLKPANVLVGDFGETVVIDWGLAKDLSREEEAGSGGAASPAATATDSGLTRVGTVMGTPSYMPPEQAAGRPVDERADVYALGAILYHLLAGTRPYDGNTSEQVLQRVVQGPPPPLAQRQKYIPADLLAIVAKAMAREPARRYATARELAEDLRRFQTGQIVGAYQYSRLELVRRFVRRYRATVTVTGVALLLLAGLGGVSVRRILAERDAANTARQQALSQTDELLLLQAREAVERDPNEAIGWLQRLSPGFTRWSAVRTIAANARAHGFASVLRGHAEALDDITFTSDGKRLVSSSDDHTLRIWDLERGESRVLSGHTDEVWRVQLLPDGRHLLSSGKDGTLRRWDLETGEGEVFATLSGPVSGFSVTQDGRRLLAGSRMDDVLHVWDLSTGEERTFHTGEGGIDTVVPSPDGRFVFLGGAMGALSSLGDLERGTFQLLREAHIIHWSTFSPSGELFTGTGEGSLFVWEPRSGKGRLLVEGLAPITALAFVPERQQLVIGGQDGSMRLLDVATGHMTVLEGHQGKVTHLSVSPDGRYIASSSADSTARVWELATLEVRVLRGAHERTHPVVFSPDGRLLAVASQDGQARLYSVETQTHRVLSVLPATQIGLKLSPDGRRLATLASTGTLRLLDAASGALLFEKEHESIYKSAMDFSPDGRWLAASGPAGQLHLWNAITGRAERLLAGHSRLVTTLIFSRDGRWLASADEGGELRLWNLASGEGRLLGAHGKRVFQLAFSPDGRRLASASADRTVRVWNVASGASQVLRGHEDEVRTVAFSPDGRRLVSGGLDHTVRFWDLESGQSQRQDASGSGVLGAVFSPDGALVATRSQTDGRVVLWDGRTGQPRGALLGHQGDVLDIAFSPDGTRLASASIDKTVRVWDLASGESRALRGHLGQVGTVAFLPDGRSLVSTGQDGSIRLWPDDLPSEPDALRAWMKTVTHDTRAPGFVLH